MGQEVFHSELRRIDRNPWIMGLAALPFLVTSMLAAAAVSTPSFLIGIPHTLLFGAAAMSFAWRKNWSPVVRTIEVRADSAGVKLGEDFVARSQMIGGLVKPHPLASRVLLRRSFGLPIELQAGSHEEARALLQALRLDVSQTVADFRARSMVLAKRRYGLFMAVSGLLPVAITLAWMGSPDVGFLAFLLSMVTFVALTVIPSRLRVGADGVEFRWLHTRRFLAYERIASVVRYRKGWGNSSVLGLRFTLRSGEEVLVPVEQGRGASDQTALIEERIREAMGAVRAGDVAVDAAMLERGARPVRDWVTMLRAIGAGANATLRTAPVPRERLMRIVEDPSQPAAARAAAAVALGSELDEEGRVRLRLAADATAAPKLRVAIEKAASGQDDAEIEAALSEVDAEVEQDHPPRRER